MTRDPAAAARQERVAALRDAALAARANAYAPYSGFAVGAAVETMDGQRFAGCNVENAASPQSICAERNALSSAVAAGGRGVRRIYVIADPPSAPCGACRSVIAELGGPDAEVIVGSLDGTERVWRLAELLPDAFEMDAGIGRRLASDDGSADRGRGGPT
jgi:cytidine deaminase